MAELGRVVAAVRGEEVAAVRVRDLVRLLRGVDGVQGPQQLLLVSRNLSSRFQCLGMNQGKGNDRMAIDFMSIGI